jgi:uncharacterized protein YqjF (DUF2071 family)
MMTPTFLTAEWRKLIMAQYEVAPDALTPWLPRGVELDLYNDCGKPRCYVSLVGFLFDHVRIKGIAVPFHTRFEEVNLRFYVARTEPDGTRRRGVVFISEFVPRTAISVIARSLYEEPYQKLPMRHRIASTAESLTVEYAWRNHGIWNRMEVEASPKANAITVGSFEEFITEHYWGYTKRTRGTTSEYGVRHPRWSIYPVRSFVIDANLEALYGHAFASLNAVAPANILLAEGSEVSVSSGARIAD